MAMPGMKVTKHAGGRPCKFQTLQQLQTAIDAYFVSCYKVDEATGELIQSEPFTITGLALALDTSRETLMDIEGMRRVGYSKEFADAVKKAKLRCQNYAERQMYLKGNPAGPIFALKNYGWRDTQEIIQTTKINHQVDLSLLTADQLQQLQQIMSAATPQLPEPVIDAEVVEVLEDTSGE